VRIHQIAVLRDARRIKITVEMPDPDRYLTSQVPDLPRNLFRLLPTMAEHTCHNDHGVSFRKECRKTEIPHLFEHLVLELQAQAEPVAVLRGETEWNWRLDPRGYFHVTVDYENELLALGVIQLAERMIVALDGKQMEMIDLPTEIDRLRRLAALSREGEAPTFGFSAGKARSDSLPTTTRRRISRRRTWAEVAFHPVVTTPEGATENAGVPLLAPA
jgi:hypothetical protein